MEKKGSLWQELPSLWKKTYSERRKKKDVSNRRCGDYFDGLRGKDQKGGGKCYSYLGGGSLGGSRASAKSPRWLWGEETNPRANRRREKTVRAFKSLGEKKSDQKKDWEKKKGGGQRIAGIE